MTSTTTTPTPSDGDHSREEAVAAVRDRIKGIRIAMLTTVDEQGRLVSQPMATQDTDFDGAVWFIAERSSAKVSNLHREPAVNLAYSGKDDWVSISGTADVVDDRSKLGELWNTFTDVWLEGGPENPENVLIRVDTETAELWDSPGAAVMTWRMAKAKVTGGRPDATNETVDLT